MKVTLKETQFINQKQLTRLIVTKTIKSNQPKWSKDKAN